MMSLTEHPRCRSFTVCQLEICLIQIYELEICLTDLQNAVSRFVVLSADGNIGISFKSSEPVEINGASDLCRRQYTFMRQMFKNMNKAYLFWPRLP